MKELFRELPLLVLVLREIRRDGRFRQNLRLDDPPGVGILPGRRRCGEIGGPEERYRESQILRGCPGLCLCGHAVSCYRAFGRAAAEDLGKSALEQGESPRGRGLGEEEALRAAEIAGEGELLFRRQS